jgi:DNA mismatch repair protein MutS
VVNLQDTYREKTGISNLKIKHRATWGYFVEINSRDHKKLDEKEFKHFQTKVSSMCFKTEDIRDLEQQINSASLDAQNLEEKLFESLVNSVRKES